MPPIDNSSAASNNDENQLPTGEDLSKIIRKIVEGNSDRVDINDVQAKQRMAANAILNQQEHREKLLQLKPRLLEISPDAPLESPDLQQMNRLYDLNLVPDWALEAFNRRDFHTFREGLKRGGMFNRFHPTPKELAEYPEDYESVRDQVVSDLLGTSKRPGSYHVMGLFDTEEVLRSYLSFRLPPRMPADPALQAAYTEEREAYIAYLEAILLDESLAYMSKWDIERMRRQFSSMWEFDTINVDPEWGGAASIVIRSSLQFMKDDMGKLPDSSFCYHFKGLKYEDDESLEQYLWKSAGENKRSRDFLDNIGFSHMADKFNPMDEIVRELPDGNCYPYHCEWTYKHNGRDRFQRELASYMRSLKLLGQDEELLH